MANRPMYHAIEVAPFYERCDIEFQFYSGFSVSQNQKCIRSLHESYLQKYPNRVVLEISSKSEMKLGVALSAFNLRFSREEKEYTVETAFQGSKVFENGKQYSDLYDVTSREAKSDARLRESGAIVGYDFCGESFPNQPKNFFYNWIYINALSCNNELATEVLKYDSFSDIVFNPKRSVNCQAMAAATFVGLSKTGMLDSALKSKESFCKIVYG